MSIELIALEIAWSLPLIALSVFALVLLSRLTPPVRVVLSLLLGAGLGIAYAVAISFIAGPMVTAVPIPLLPFMGTIGATVGSLRGVGNWRRSMVRLNISIFLTLIGFIWISYFALRNYMDSVAGSFRIVVVRREPSLEPLHWDESDDWVSLSHAERKRVQESLGNTGTGILMPLTSLNVGAPSKGAAILVMLRDASQRIQFPMPDRGIAVFIQNQDGTWREDLGGAHFGMNNLGVLPAPGSDFTRLEIEGPFGTQSSEIGVSHK